MAHDDTTLPAFSPSEAPLFVDPEVTQGEASSASAGRPRSGFQGRYELGEQLARGGMGEVLRCMDRSLRREVALKRLRRSSLLRKGRLARFVREAQITAQLEHPAIVPVHELGLHREEPYFTMKRVEGETLQQLIDRLRLGQPEACARFDLARRLRVLIQVCQAVSFAHSRGVLHRDLKPANIMVGAFGEVLVMDWGLARLIGAPDEDDGALEPSESGDESGSRASSVSAETLDPELRTRVGQAIGTPMYMSPEQARGELSALDERSDVYSLGALLLSLTALRRPLALGPTPEVLDRVRAGAIILPGADPDDPPVPPALVGIIAKAMARDRAQRYASVTALIADLEAFLSDGAVSAYQDRLGEALSKWARRNRSQAWALGAGVLALILGTIGAFAVQRARVAQRVRERLAQASTELAAGRAEASRELYSQALGLDPDSSAAREGLREAVLLAERRQLEVRAQAAEAALAAALDAAAAASEGERLRWYRAQSEALSRARALLRLERDSAPGREAAQALCRRLARRLAEDRNFVMAELMLTEAAEAGLSPILVAAERAKLEGERLGAAERLLDRARGILRASEGLMRVSEERFEGWLAELTAEPHPELTRLLIARVFASPTGTLERGDSPRAVTLRLCFAALSRLGDAQSEALIARNALEGIAEHGRDGPARPALAARLDPLLANPARRIRLDAPTAAELILLEWSLRTATSAATFGVGAEEALAIAGALALRPDGRSARALSAARWQMGLGGSFFARAAELQQRLAAPGEEPPQERAARLEDARWRYAMGDFAGALEGFEAAEAESAEDAEASYGRAASLIALGQPQLAFEVLNLALGRAPGDARLLQLRAEARMDLSDPKEALGDLNESYDDLAWSPALLLRRARAFRGLGDAERALSEAAAALLRDPSFVEAAALRAELFEARGETGAAFAALSEALAWAPHDPALRCRRAALAEALGAPETALRDYSHALEHAPGHREALLGRARLLPDSEATEDLRAYGRRCEIATRDLERVVEEDADSWRLRGWLALQRARSSERLRPGPILAEARRCLERSLALARTTEALRLYDELLTAIPDEPARIPVLEELIAREDEVADCDALCDLLRDRDRAEEARAVAVAALARHPEESGLVTQVEWTIRQAEGEEAAQAWLEARLEQSEGKARAAVLTRLAIRAMTPRGDNSQAIALFREALTLAPDRPRVRYLLGKCRLYEQDWDGAKRDARAVLRDDGDDILVRALARALIWRAEERWPK